jgi:hypothetical protein
MTDLGAIGSAVPVPEFDMALWGYDREQVEDCLADLATRLADAERKLSSVELLQAQLYEAQVELDQQRRGGKGQPPSFSEQLAKIMEAAEELRGQAEREAAAARSRRKR